MMDAKELTPEKELNRLRSTINSLEKIVDSDMSNKRKINHIDITLFKLREWYGDSIKTLTEQ